MNHTSSSPLDFCEALFAFNSIPPVTSCSELCEVSICSSALQIGTSLDPSVFGGISIIPSTSPSRKIECVTEGNSSDILAIKSSPESMPNSASPLTLTTSPKDTGTVSLGVFSKISKSPTKLFPVSIAHSEGGKTANSTPKLLKESVTYSHSSAMSDLTFNTASRCCSEISSSMPPAKDHFLASRCPNEPAP